MLDLANLMSKKGIFSSIQVTTTQHILEVRIAMFCVTYKVVLYLGLMQKVWLPLFKWILSKIVTFKYIQLELVTNKYSLASSLVERALIV